MKKGAEIALLAFFCLFSAAAIAAEGISINCGEAPYSSLPAVQGIGNGDEEALQEAAGVAIAGEYRSLHGAGSLPVGTQITVTWQNGSSEKMLIELVSATVGVSPIPGTQKSGGGGGGGGSGGGVGGGGSGGGGGAPIVGTGCDDDCCNCNPTVTVGDGG